MGHKLHIVDVFARQPYSGNQLAVVVGNEELPPETMLKIAAEMNFSETTFVKSVPEKNGEFHVRIFTPAREIDFAGHPILGTAWVIRHHVVMGLPRSIDLLLPVGKISVSLDQNENVWFKAPGMSLGKTCDRESIAPALGITPDDIETRAPIQQVSAGTSAVIVPLRSLAALERSYLNLAKYDALAKQGFPKLVYLFCTETRSADNDLSARFFFDAHGVREDPATGNGAAFLGEYLLRFNFFPKTDLSLRIGQGYMVQRPSLVLLRAHIRDNRPEVSVGGGVIPIVTGDLLNTL